MKNTITTVLVSFVLLSTMFSGAIGLISHESENLYAADGEGADENTLFFDPITAVELDQIVSDEGIICTIYGDGTVRIDEFPADYGGKYTAVLNVPATIRYNGEIYEVAVIGNGAIVRTQGPSSLTRSTSITVVNIPSSVVKIEDAIESRNFTLYSGAVGIFRYPNLREINIAGDSLKYIGDGAFFGVKLTSFTLPDSVEYVGCKSFTGLTGLTITENSKLKGVGIGAFNGLPSDVSIVLPDSVTHVSGGMPFGKASVTYPAQFIIDQGVVYDSEGKTAISFSGTATNVTIRNGVETISDFTFYTAPIVSVTIPDSVNNIGDYSFAKCTLLGSVILTQNSSLKIIGANAFAVGWEDFTTISQFGAALSIFGWEGNGTMTFPKSLETIGDFAFASLDIYGARGQGYNNKISAITFVDDNDLKYVGRYAFLNVYGGTITFGSSSNSVDGVVIDDCAFSYRGGGTSATSMSQIERVIFDPEIFKLESIGYLAFGTYLQSNNSSSLNAKFSQFGNTFEEVIIPATVKTIGNSAFSYDGAISNEPYNVFLIPNITKVSFAQNSQIDTIGTKAFARFSGCETIDLSNSSELVTVDNEAFSLKTINGKKMSGAIVLPNSSDSSLETIGAEAFFGRTLLPEATDNNITVPSTVKFIGDRAFALSTSGNSTSYTSSFFTFDANIISLGSAAFGYRSNGSIYSDGIYFGNGVSTTSISIPADTVLMNAEILRSVNIISIAVAPGNATFFTDGEMLYIDAGRILIKALKTISVAEIGDDVELICSYAFYGCNDLEALFIYGNTSIEKYAFMNCSSLKAALITSSSIENDSFYGCVGLNLFGSLGDAIGEELSQHGNYAGETYMGNGGAILLISNVSNCLLNISDGTYSSDIFSFSVRIPGGYTYYDMTIMASDGSTVSHVDGVYSVTMSSMNPISLMISFDAKDRGGEKWDLTLHSTEGEFENGSDTAIISVPKGMSILESEMISPTKNKSVIAGWYTDSGLTQEFDILNDQVNSSMSLYPRWVAADPQVTFGTPYGVINAFVSGNILNNGERTFSEVTFEFVPKSGYELVSWIVTEYGHTSVIYDGAMLAITPEDDISVEVNVRYSSGANLNHLIYSDTPVSDMITAWQVGGFVDTSMITWSGHSSVPVIIEDHVYIRIGDRLYMVETDTGYVVKSVPSKTSTAFYHYVGAGNGMILDYQTGRVYDQYLNFLYSMPSEVKSAVYFDGYFYGPTTLGDIVRFDASTGRTDGEWILRATNWFGLYGGYSAPLFIDGYMYFISNPGGDLRQMASVSLTDSNDSHTLTFTGLSKHLLDDGWITYNDGRIYLSSYVEGLFGTRVANGNVTITSVSVNKGMFGIPNYTVVELNINGEATNFYSLTSAFVIYDGKGYINVSGGTEGGSKSYMIVYDVRTMTPLYYCESDRSHGGIVVNVSHADNGDVCVYLIPYQSGRQLMVFLDNGSSLTVADSSYPTGTYNSQAVRADEDGRMMWYNDSGWVRGVTVAEKNPYYFFIEDAGEAKWVVGYGSNAAEALSSAGYENVPGSAYALRSLVIQGTLSQYLPDDYEWKTVSRNSMDASEYTGSHYWIIATKDLDTMIHSLWNHDNSIYTFIENIGDRDLIGVDMIFAGRAVSVSGIKLEKNDLEMAIGDSFELQYTIEPSDAYNKDVLWTSSDTSVASVDHEGNVRALKVGTATIIVRTDDGMHEAFCSLTVTPLMVLIEPSNVVTDNGVTIVNITDSELNNAVNAVNAASDSIMAVNVSADSQKIVLNIPAIGLKDLIGDTVFKVDTSAGMIVFDNMVVSKMANAGDSLTLIVERIRSSELTDKQEEKIGENPVFNVTLMADGVDISDLNGTAKITLPYQLVAGGDASLLKVWNVGAEGNVTEYECVYDPSKQTVTFETQHFSYYAVIYDDPAGNEGDGGNDIGIYLITAAIAIVIVIGIVVYMRLKQRR